MRRFAPLALALFLTSAACWGTTLHVPDEYPTIQSALDSLQDDDTVLVHVGIYAEALVGPPHRYVIKGDVLPDTGDYPRPIIDPSSLPGSTSLACFTANAGQPVIEDMRFVNGPQMYPHPLGAGGTSLSCARADFRRCSFDSTRFGTSSSCPQGVHLDSCRFYKVDYPVWAVQEPVFIADCRFIRCTGDWIVVGGDNSQVVRSQSDGNIDGTICELDGQGWLIQNCVFGPSYSPELNWDNALVFLGNGPGVVEGCLFTGLNVGSAFIGVMANCDGRPGVVIRHNTFTVSATPSRGGSPQVQIDRNIGTGLCNVRIDSNLFEDNHTHNGVGKGIFFADSTDGLAVGNRFHRLTYDQTGNWPHPPTILTQPPQSGVLRANHFDSTDVAVGSWNNMPDTLDARWNWWGDSTGPYEHMNHREGRGDTVAVGTDYTPWCTDSRTCEEPNATQDRHFILHPSSFNLSSYPNPFNSTTTLRLEGPEAEIVRIELFDILGRRVRELWSGAVSEEKEILLDGSNLASGVYFVRAMSTTWNRPLVSTKIVLLK